MKYISYLNSLINALKREYIILFSNFLNNNNKIFFTKNQFLTSKLKIEKLIESILTEISNLKNNILPKKLELKKKKEINLTLTKTIFSLQSNIKKARAALTKNIKFLQKQNLSNSSYNYNEISHTDLINVSLRINKQSSFPINYPLNFNIPFSFLLPYPDENFEMNHSILKFNLNNKLELPILEPKGGTIKKGTLIKITYPQIDNDVFFKYSLDNNIIPSYFSGNLYKSDLKIIINRNCNLNVVSCKFGFKDSDILTVGFTVSEEEGEMINKTLTSERTEDVIVKPITKIEKGKVSGIHFSDYSPHYTDGKSDYRNSAYRNSIHSNDYDDDPL